ncbi:5'-adenylylsulfate reductase-like 4 [Silene latifolia]|uniref:5'-adenylylsulfate reductase-like 4 n=1 Tax=Silene latifolia TaxID=37657 RepID=UPI003D76BC3A
MRNFWGAFVVLVVVLFAELGRVDSAKVSELGSCPAVPITDAILGLRDSICRLHHSYDVAVIEGDEGSLQKALHLVYSLNQDFVAVLFYAHWCPFSRNFRPSFSILSTLYPSIPHFAIAESVVKPSILSKYGVHGFPTLFLLNSTMRVRYRGSRSLSSLVSFYSDVIGIEGDPRDQLPFDKIESASNQEENDKEEEEDCPFSWARSPENMLKQETYLALATTFVVLRLMYLVFPCLLEFARSWRRNMQCVRVTNLWERPLRYLKQNKTFLSSIRDPCKASNFQEGAINARAWASKSLASAVSIDDASSSRVVTATASH